VCTALPTSTAPTWTATAPSTPPTLGLSLVSSRWEGELGWAPHNCVFRGSAGHQAGPSLLKRSSRHVLKSRAVLKAVAVSHADAQACHKPQQLCHPPTTCQMYFLSNAPAGDSYKLGTKGLIAVSGCLTLAWGRGDGLTQIAGLHARGVPYMACMHKPERY